MEDIHKIKCNNCKNNPCELRDLGTVCDYCWDEIRDNFNKEKQNEKQKDLVKAVISIIVIIGLFVLMDIFFA